MLPLRTKASILRAERKLVLKVADLDVFASNQWPIEEMALDTRLPDSSRVLDELMKLPWGALVSDSSHREHGGASLCSLDDPRVVQPGDVVTVDPHSQFIRVLFRRSAKSNSLFTTENCNNFCLMCSQPPRSVDDSWRQDEMVRTLELMDKDVAWLGITGGEPTLLGERLATILEQGVRLHPNTRFHVLSNGRRFSNSEFTNLFQESKARTVWAIPLYGDCAALHDYVVQERGAHAETIRGLYSLESRGHTVEIRVVLHRPTISRLIELAKFIASSMPFAAHVALMGLEPTGFARANRDALWIDPADYAETLAAATEILADVGMNVSIYNLPLCALPKDLWTYSRDSISEWKRHHLSICGDCCVKSRCGGFFASHTSAWQSRNVRAIRKEELCLTLPQ